MYFGQQKIQAGVIGDDGQFNTTGTIADQDQMNAITYQVSADPVATNGTWAANNIAANAAYNKFGQHMDSILGITTNGFNYPINVYPAGNYGYSVTPNDSDAAGTPVTVNYPAGLGTSVSANFKDSNAASLNVTMVDSSGLGFGASNANGPLMNGQLTSNNANPDANVVFNTNVTTTGTNGSAITNNSTITLTKDSTRPQSV